MTPSNFNWFLHVMLFQHTRLVIEKQTNKANDPEEEEEDSDDDNNRGDNID